RAEGYTRYTVHPAGERDAYSAVLYLEPMSDGNRRRLGLDMLADPRLRPAMERARDEDRLVETPRITALATEANADAGFLWFLPIYANGRAHGSAAERRAHLEGWIHATFRMPAFMGGILEQQFGETDATLGFKIYDGDPSTAD